MTASLNRGLDLQEPVDLEVVDLDSQTETFSSTSSLSVHSDDDNDGKSRSVPKRLQTPNLHQHAEAALHLTSDFKTFFNTCIAFLGSGVLGLPYAFRKCGIMMGFVTLVGVAAVSTYSMMLVVQCKYKLKEQGHIVSKYGEIGYFAVGQIGSIIVDAALVISQTGFCTAYLIFIATNANKFLEVSKTLVVSVCVPPLIVFSLLRHMKELAYVALLADFMCILGLLVVLTIDLSYMNFDHDQIESIGVASAIPFFFGVASYCFEGVGMVLPLENSMRNKHNFQPILVCTVVIITTLYATFGICGYLAFGDETDAVITFNLKGSGSLVTLVKIFLCLGLFFTYPVMLFPVFEVLQPLLLCGNKLEETQITQKKRILLRAGIVLITAVIAAGIPDFGRFISFIGSTCCMLLAFILPAFFYMRLHRDEPRSCRKWLHQLFRCAIIFLGFVMLGMGIVEPLANKKAFGFLTSQQYFSNCVGHVATNDGHTKNMVHWGTVFVTVTASSFLLGRRELPKIGRFVGLYVGRSVGAILRAKKEFFDATSDNNLVKLQREFQRGIEELNEIRSELTSVGSMRRPFKPQSGVTTTTTEPLSTATVSERQQIPLPAGGRSSVSLASTAEYAMQDGLQNGDEVGLAMAELKLVEQGKFVSRVENQEGGADYVSASILDSLLLNQRKKTDATS